MSRKITSLLYRTTQAVTLPMAERVRFKTKSGLIAKIQKDLNNSVQTKRGPIKLLSYRGKNIAAAVSGFETDEPEMFKWIDTMTPGDTFWDIGANIGLFTMYAAMRGDLSVLSFEPNGLNFGITMEHLILNRLDQNAQCYCIAFSEKTEIGQLVCGNTDVGQAGNNLIENDGTSLTQENPESFRQHVPVYAVDGFCQTFKLPAPEHIKLDVDGLEHLILRGAFKTLSQIKSLMIEIEGDDARKKELLDLVLSTGLKERDISGQGGKGRNRLFVRSGE